MKKKKAEAMRPLLGQILQKIAPRIGAIVVMEPEWHIVGQIIFKNGRKRYFRYSSLDLNPLGASEIAKDKDYSAFFMAKLGYPTVPGKTFFSASWARAIGSKRDMAAAYRYAKKLGFPVIVKPNSGSQGVGVFQAYTKRELYQALRFVFVRDRIALVQKPVSGKDYRIVVLDERVISAYQRVPLSVVGDGRSTVRQLLKQKQAQFVATGRDTNIKMADPRIVKNLNRQNLMMRSVLKEKQVVFLLGNANLSSGGDAIEVTRKMHPDFQKIAVRLTKDMGLRLCGVDLMVAGDISQQPAQYWVLEINAAPGLDHYVKTGKEQERIVEKMYLEVLKAMEL